MVRHEKTLGNKLPKHDVSYENRLVWLDMEMTGLNPEKERIIEVAVVVTESDLNVVAEGPVLVVHQSESLLEAMDRWNQSTHRKSGLIDKVKASVLTEAEAEIILLDFLKQHVPPGKSPLCGNSVSQDRRFMVRYMPQLEQFFHYRHLDVSTLKELVRRWRPDLCKKLDKKNRHEALSDIYESIDELKYYRTHFLNLDPNTTVSAKHANAHASATSGSTNSTPPPTSTSRSTDSPPHST